MRSHADRTSVPARQPAASRQAPERGFGPGRAVTTGPAEGHPSTLSRDDVAELQAQAGNRATVQALRSGAVVQRALSVEQAETVARRIEDAISGLGTDEEAIYGALAGRTPSDYQAIREAYSHLFSEDLDAELADDLTEGELARVRSALDSTSEVDEAESEEAQVAKRQDRSRSVAEQLRDAMEGLGTEEDQIFNALEGRDASEIDEIRRQYRDLTGRWLERDLREDLSGADLTRALAAIEAGNAGTFRNAFSQDMTEGMTTYGEGHFEWEIKSLKFLVHVDADFQPDEGVVAPMALWQGQIRSVWNVFKLEEPGGVSMPIEFDFNDADGAERTIRVKQNKVPGVKSQEDRANAGMWFPAMSTDTAPHEFGHLIGLDDEYQRTHGDYQRVTGQDRTGPENASGQSPIQTATALKTALYDSDASKRAPKATKVLEDVGLIAGGIPQQGDWAQSVMRTYDDAFSGTFSKTLLEAIRDKCEEGSTWNLLTVFSYASGTVMGNPGTVGVTEHEHPVEPRHLRFMLDIVRQRYPSLQWSLARA